MSRARSVLLRIIGSVVGLLIGGIGGVSLAFLGLWLCLLPFEKFDLFDGSSEERLLASLLIAVCGALFGAPIGAAAGTTVAQRCMKQRSSFWRSLLLAGVATIVSVPGVWVQVGIPVAVILVVAGAVIGSGWKAGPANAAGIRS